MKEITKMSAMPSGDREALQSIQEGLSGVKEINDNWIRKTIDILQKNTELIKSMFAGKGDALG